MSVSVFVYGSNMCSGRLRDYGVIPQTAGAPARLHGYRLAFNKRSTDMSGKANLEVDASSLVWGVLYSLSTKQLDRLDEGEKGYARQSVRVHLTNNRTSEVWTYVAKVADASGLRPYAWYKRFLVEGAREHKLPIEYVATLDAIESMEDPDHARDTRKRALHCRPEEAES